MEGVILVSDSDAVELWNSSDRACPIVKCTPMTDSGSRMSIEWTLVQQIGERSKFIGSK